MNKNSPPDDARQEDKVDPAAQVSKTFEDFVYLISHDVRGSVRALIELPQWLADDMKDAGIKIEGSVAKTLDLMNRHTARLDRMLVDLLVYSRIGNMQTIGPVQVRDAVTEVLDEIYIPQGFDIEQKVDDITIEIGNRDILTLFTALISNAFKHHDKPKGTIRVTVSADKDEAVIKVEDDGPGIADEHHERVFAAMATLRPRDEVEGSGMGLAIVRKIAERYGGSASARPNGKRKRGTQMIVRLPLPST